MGGGDQLLSLEFSEIDIVQLTCTKILHPQSKISLLESVCVALRLYAHIFISVL